MTSQEYLYLIALTKTAKIGPVIGKNLISYCGGIEAVFKETKKNLIKIPKYRAEIERMKKKLVEVKKEYKDTEPAGELK